MLKIIHFMEELDFGQLMFVYEQSNRENGEKFHSRLSENEQLLQAEQDFYNYLRQFFSDTRAFYAVWASGGIYKAALRMDPYLDGYLLEALETAPEARGKGYATVLVRELLAHLSSRGRIAVYSHVSKKNMISLTVHHSCGFQIIKDYAVFIDGSVSSDAYTLQYCT